MHENLLYKTVTKIINVDDLYNISSEIMTSDKNGQSLFNFEIMFEVYEIHTYSNRTNLSHNYEKDHEKYDDLQNRLNDNQTFKVMLSSRGHSSLFILINV